MVAKRQRIASRPSATRIELDEYEYIYKIILTVQEKFKRSEHELYFDNEPLSKKEMLERGFVGELLFEENNEIIRRAELEAGPVGEFPGKTVGRLVFKIMDADGKVIPDLQVVSFKYIIFNPKKTRTRNDVRNIQSKGIGPR